jgi:hypothetical protein
MHWIDIFDEWRECQRIERFRSTRPGKPQRSPSIPHCGIEG